MSQSVLARAPGRVNLIGEHTDYTGGLALPVAINLEVRIRLTIDEAAVGSGHFFLTSQQEADPAQFPVAEASLDPLWLRQLDPAWTRLAAAVLAALGFRRAARGRVLSSLPVGAGLASSAAFEVAVALALGARLDPLALARLCQLAEQAATGVPSGLMDQLVASAGVPGCALLVDFAANTFDPVPVPEQLELLVVDSGQRRRLGSSSYAERRRELEEAERQVGPLRLAGPQDLRRISDQVVRRRARHVVTENARVLAAADLLRRGDGVGLGQVLSDGQRSYAGDFEASTPSVDLLVDRLVAQPGVYGARLTGGGFGGCVVVVAEPGTFDRCAAGGVFPRGAWLVTPTRGASVKPA